jgi:SAM-dependent methyltransferase
LTSRYGGYDDQEFVAEFYDPVYAAHNRKDIEFFIQYSKKVKGRTLELGCGTGRVLIPTALAGCEITGLDLSQYMLSKCQEKLAKQPEEVQERVRLIREDMTDFSTGEVYSLVTIPFRPFQHLISVEEQKACLDCVSKHLVPRGLLILDIFHVFPPATYDPKYRAEQPDCDFKLADGRSVRRSMRIADFHPSQQYNDIEMIYYVSYPDGRSQRLVQAFPMRYFFRYEVEHLLNLCGFKIAELFGDYDSSKFSDDSPEMIFVAEKK